MKESSGQARRGILPLLIVGLVVCAGLGAGAWYWWQNQCYETTDNAYFTGNMVEVNAETAGTVVAITREANDPVTANALLVSLADGDALAVLEQRKQALALAVQKVQVQRAEVERLQAEQQRLVVQGRLALSEYRRRQRLVAEKMVSQEELDAARSARDDNQAALNTAAMALAKARVSAGSQPLLEHPYVAAAAAQLRSAYRNWRKTQVFAPVAGQIARRRVQVGQRIAPGTPLYSIAQRHGGWVEANFKETQLGHIQPGNKVLMQSDLYGDELSLKGQVESIGVGTGAVFALLPPQNATGNWIKIVQRVPVRIKITEGLSADKPLPFGASLHVRVDTRAANAAPLDTATNMPLASINVDDYQNEGVESLIQTIIDRQRL